MHGLKGRILSAMAFAASLITAMQMAGAFELMPPKVAAVILAIGVTITVFSERVQGGASKPKKRAAAAASDARKARAVPGG